jgi:hypothetical protein
MNNNEMRFIILKKLKYQHAIIAMNDELIYDYYTFFSNININFYRVKYSTDCVITLIFQF